MRLVIMNFDSIPTHLPQDCEISVPYYVERFLKDAAPLDLLNESEKKLLQYIRFSESTSYFQTNKKGYKMRICPPVNDIHKRIESQYMSFFNRETV